MDVDDYPEPEPVPADCRGQELKVGTRCVYGGIDTQLCEILEIEWDDEGCTVRIGHDETEEHGYGGDEYITSSLFTRAYGDPVVEFSDLEVVS